MYESNPPFDGATTSELMDSILNEEISFASELSKDTKDLITKHLMKNPKERLGHGESNMEEIKKHPYFKGVDWKAVYDRKIVSEFIPGDKLSNFDQEFTDAPIMITPSSSVGKFDHFFGNFK